MMSVRIEETDFILDIAKTESVDGLYSKSRPIQKRTESDWDQDEILDPVKRHWYSRPLEIQKTWESLHRLEGLRRILEWTYGYRPPLGPKQRFTRRAPSAGAMYPSEIYVVPPPDQCREALIYSFENQLFFPVEGSDSRALQDQLRIGPGWIGVVLVSYIRRSLKRYGVRGYRYCLLDAGEILSGLHRNAAYHGMDVRFTSAQPDGVTSSCLGLERDELAFYALEFNPTSDFRLPDLPDEPAYIPQSIAPGVEEHPELSRMIRSVVAFHNSGQGCLPRPRMAVDAAFLRRAYIHPDQRYSASSFVPGQVPAGHFMAVLEHARSSGFPMWDDFDRGRIAIFGIAFEVEGMAAGVYAFDAGTSAGWRRIKDGVHGALQAGFKACCQSQSIISDCAFATVICMDPGVSEDAAANRISVIGIGFLDAEAQFKAAALELGNTCIGGFSDQEMSDLLGVQGLKPIVAHIFGLSGTGPKTDAIGRSMKYSAAW